MFDITLIPLIYSIKVNKVLFVFYFNCNCSPRFLQLVDIIMPVYSEGCMEETASFQKLRQSWSVDIGKHFCLACKSRLKFTQFYGFTWSRIDAPSVPKPACRLFSFLSSYHNNSRPWTSRTGSRVGGHVSSICLAIPVTVASNRPIYKATDNVSDWLQSIFTFCYDLLN